MSKQSSGTSWVVAGIIVVVLAAGGIYLARRATQSPAPSPAPVASAPTPAPAPASSAPVIEHPIAQVPASAASTARAPLPALGDSDAEVAAALDGLAGSEHLKSLLIRTQIIPRIVATVDALPRRNLGSFILPVHGAKGSLVTRTVDGQTVIADANAQRYAPYMRVLESVDPQALVDWYVRYYPLFQQAYAELGYPKGYFNDRLVVVIDNLLATPDLAKPALLTPAQPYYKYADPSLEALSVGQKTMLRVGPANEAKLKAALRAIRARLVGATLPGAPAPAAAGH